MSTRSLLYAALGGAFILAAGVPASAQPYDHHDHFDRGQHDRGRFDHRDFHRRDWRRGYEAPPYVVAPPSYGYYSPPPVSYGPWPGISFGINIR